MTRRLTQAALSAAVLAACLGAALTARASEPAGYVAAPGGSIQVVGSDSSSRFVQLGIGKSVVIDLPRDVKDVLVAEPKYANAVIRSTRRAYLIGVAVGQTNIFFFDAEGRQIAGFDVAVGQNLVDGNGVQGTAKNISATLRAMERAGVIRTLAEPNLTAISGEGANFLAGGEFPIPAGYQCDPTTRICQLAIQFKKFGVGLNFIPVVLSECRISLKVMTEVSELSNENSITLSFGQSTQNIPSIKTRRAETTVEIPSGGALAMAGMIQEQTKHAISGFPGLMQLPVLGTLFKSRDYVNRQTELMVIVTPYIARAVARKDLSRPDDGFQDPSDPAAVLLGRLNKIYGAPGNTAPAAGYQGKYGFILD